MRDFSSRKVRQIIKPVIKLSEVRPVLRVDAYCRVSTNHDEQLGSLSYQQKYYQELIEPTTDDFFILIVLLFAINNPYITAGLINFDRDQLQIALDYAE